MVAMMSQQQHLQKLHSLLAQNNMPNTVLEDKLRKHIAQNLLFQNNTNNMELVGSMQTKRLH